MFEYEKFDIWYPDYKNILNLSMDVNTPSINKFNNKIKYENFNFIGFKSGKYYLMTTKGYTLGRFAIHKEYNHYNLTDLISGCSISTTKFKSLVDSKNKVKKFLELIVKSEYNSLNFLYYFQDNKEEYLQFEQKFWEFINELSNEVFITIDN